MKTLTLEQKYLRWVKEKPFADKDSLLIKARKGSRKAYMDIVSNRIEELSK